MIPQSCKSKIFYIAFSALIELKQSWLFETLKPWSQSNTIPYGSSYSQEVEMDTHRMILGKIPILDFHFLTRALRSVIFPPVSSL